VLAPFTTFLKDFQLARIHPLDFENDEFGASQLTELPTHTALGAFTCVKCGRCFDHCPARLSGKRLDPKQLMLDLRAGFLADPEQPIIGEVLDTERIWQCTTCGACTYQCPVGIDQVVPILETRRGLAAEGEVPETFNTTFNNLERSRNPWGYPAHEADSFLQEHGFPAYEGQEFLYWMGCLARYDLQYRKVALAFKRILDAAGVSYGVLAQEQCTGDAARRAGNEYLFQELATANVEQLKAAGVTKVVATCPHCIRTLREYRDLEDGIELELVHHTTLIRELLDRGRLQLTGTPADGKLIYHDPCYLSRYLQGGDARQPRAVLAAAAGAPPVEAERCRARSLCCGAGGAMIFAEETEGKRINMMRTEELLGASPDRISVACPFCQVMIRDAVGDLGKGDDVKVLDVAQIVAERLPASE
jgi:Fe-S oxidoreductase